MPLNYIVCTLHFNADLSEIYINRHSKEEGSFTVRLPTNRQYSRDGDKPPVDFQSFVDEWNDIMEMNRRSTSNSNPLVSEGKSEWWSTRKALDERIKSLLETMEKLIFGGFRGILTFPANQSRLSSKHVNQLQDEIGKILDCCVSRNNKISFTYSDIIHPKIIDIIFELVEFEIRNDDLEDVLYFLADCYTNYGIQMALDEMNIDSVHNFIIIR